jgi:arabinogalactan endo-1,4-beta-galactosidase
VKAAGASLLLDLHYSDTWADPGHQVTPGAWTGLDLEGLEHQIESYTVEVLGAFRQAGALPDMIQVGNEVDAGMLWPLGQLRYDADSLASWDRFTRLLKAGIRGVRAALGPADSVRIMVHYSQGGNPDRTRWFLDHLDAAGVAYDLIGLSYYPWWHGPLAGLRANLVATAERYGRDIMVVEAGYPWRAGGWEGMGSTPSAMAWPVSPEGQAQFLRDVIAAVGAAPSGRGAGVLWWYPEAIEVPGLFVWGGGSLSWFDRGGGLLPAGSVFAEP